MSNVSDPAFEGIFEEAPDIAEIIASLDGRVCDVAGDTEVFIVLDVDTNDARTAYINLSFIDSDLERNYSAYLSLKDSNWSANLNLEVGTFPDYQAVPYHVGDAAKGTHEIMSNVRNTTWQLEEEYIYEGIFPTLFLFVGLGILQLILVPIWLCMYKRGKFTGCCPCCSSYTPSKRTVKIVLGFILILALTCIVMAIAGATKIHNGLNDASEQTCFAAILLDIGGQVSILAGKVGEEMINSTVEFLLAATECPEIPLDLSLPEEGNSTVDEARIWLSEVFANTSQALTELSDDTLHIGNELSKAADTLLWILVVSSCILLLFFVIASIVGAAPLLCPKQRMRCVTLKKCVRCIVHPLGFVTLALLWLFVGLGFSFGVFTGDYCQDPNNNLASITYLEDVEDYVRYYSTCEGETDITSSLELARNSTIIIAQNIIEPALDFIYDSEIPLEACPTENLIELGERAALSVIGSYVLLVLTSTITSCAAINPLYAEVVYDSVCDDFPKGALFLAISYLLGGIFMCISAILSAIIMKRVTTMEEEQRAYPQLTGGEESATEKASYCSEVDD